ncbi:uncharacterized protein LOC8082661 isoform X3 [Sorghum bicolor]|nr:uncharacterized protein LOC8082661 isoform X3 [Sorghum bicolor]|eukprot:XP_021301357.1 uncharacterized protein LOC8082661 isoform X3 [Sorghum bicolor]
MDQNPSTVAVEPISRTNGSGAPSASDLLKKKCPSTDIEESVAGSDSLYSSSSSGDSKSVKLQTKVCLNNDLPRENAVIYSGLGLEISSPSSMEESPDGLGGLSPDVPYESPRTILQVMTYFPVPGGFLLSPLHGNLLQLRNNKVAPELKNWETHLDMENVSRALEGRSQSSHPPGPIRGNVAKQMKPCSKKKVSMDTKTRKYKGDASAIMNKEVNIQVPASQKEKMMNTNNENGFEVGSARKEIPASVKHGQLYMQPTSSVATMNADPVAAPVVIEEHWVRCDICQKLRLLPYGTNPSMLPNKWKCTMLHWLPGMNRCDISEDETTEALNALFAIPATAATFSSGGPHTAGAGTGTATSSAYNISGQFERSRKRKNAPSNGKDLAGSSYRTPLLTPSMSNQQDPIRDERTTDDMHYSSKTDSVSKHGPRPVSKSADLVSEKLKPKHRNHSSYSDEGGIMERNKAHPKVKTKIGIDQDEQKTYKRTKMEDWHQIDRGQDHKCDSDGMEVPDEPKALLAKAKTMKGSNETGDISLRKEDIASGCDSLENIKNVNSFGIPFHSEKKEHPSDVDILDLSCKKNVVKKLEEIQLNSLHRISNRSKKNLKEKKSNTFKSKEMASKADSRHGKVLHADVVLSSVGHLNYELGADKFVTGKESPAKQALDLTEAPGRYVSYLQSSTAVTSSSSKISSSRRNTNSQEAKDSPVKSASSSPPRNFNIKMISSTRKDGIVDGSLGNTHNLVRYQNSEVIALNNGQKTENFEGVQVAGEPNFHGPLQGISDSNIKEIPQSAGAQVSNITGSERSLDNSLPKASWREDLTVNDTGVGRGDHQLCSGDKKDFDMEGRSQHPFDRRATTLNTESCPIQHGSKNIEIRQGSGTAQRMGMSFEKEKSHLRIDNQDIQNPVNEVVNFPLKEGKQKVYPTSVKSDSLKMKAKLVRFNVETGVQHGTVKQATSNTLKTSPMRKDGSMITFALKEARDLKHKANDLKNKGQELESTGLYFEAALKFLHVAFLLETPSFDISRPGDGAKSMKMYSETAKLCNFCAHEYERCKKMAAAALAYKCVEVAYLKAAYYKHRSASKDQQELQAAVQIARGESPSSATPDIDNLNSHGLSKASSLKGGNSPHVPGNHLHLAVHNQAHLLRLLSYTNDVNLAFNATQKAEFVIASAAGSKERGGVDDGLALVKTVLDLNFNNVNELVRLVRVSMESISS